MRFIQLVHARKEKSFNNLTNSFTRSSSPVKPSHRARSKKPGEGIFGDEQDFVTSTQTPTQNPYKDKGKGKAKVEDVWPDEGSPIRRLTFEQPASWGVPRLATQEPFTMKSDIFDANQPPQTPMRVQEEAAPSVETVEPVDLADEVSVLIFRWQYSLTMDYSSV